MGRDFTSRGTWKGKAICCSVYKGLKGLTEGFKSLCKSQEPLPALVTAMLHARAKRKHTRASYTLKNLVITHPRNLGDHVTVRPSVPPSVRPSAPQAYQCKITQLTGITPQATRGGLAGNCMATRTFREKKQQQSRVFFDVIFNVYTHVDNRERARASD